MKSIIIYSGKGGVGKTTTTANIAKTLAKDGKKVFIIDADINTPSMGVIFGSEHPTENIWVASTSFTYKSLIFLESALVRKFLRGAIKEINEIQPDYVLIDTPPSITDVHINLMALLKISCIIIVTQPNELSRTDVNRTAMFFTEKCPDAGCVVVENMCKDEPEFAYNWKCVEKIPFVDGFDGNKAFELFHGKYEHIVKEIVDMNIEEVRLEAHKRVLFDESITVDDLPFIDKSTEFFSGICRSDIKFINLNTWDEIKERLQSMEVYVGMNDAFLDWCTTERIARMLKAFEHDDEAYFMITKAPNTEIYLIAGEIGKASLFIAESYYGMPRVKYQTSKGEVVLFPYEIMPATDEMIQDNMQYGGVITKDGRYLPSKGTVKECYEAYGSRVGLSENWESVYDSIVNGNLSKLDSLHSSTKTKAKKIKKQKENYE